MMIFLSTYKNPSFACILIDPDAAPKKGKWVCIKCDSGPGHLNTDILAYTRFHGFLLYPGVPNTTAVSQEMDQS